MQIIADLHIHSKYSRAVSQKMDLYEISNWAQKKGIHLVTTGDWTHPIWFREISMQLKETSEGIYMLKNYKNSSNFMLTTELSSIYSQDGQTRRIHNVVFSPSLKTCEQVIKALQKQGAKLMGDGRPILGISSINLIELLLSVDENILLVPAHIWTPWFSLYGSKSGFDSINDCFGKYSDEIYAIETGLSCYDNKTEVLTDNGWKKFENVTYKDKIFTLNLKTEIIELHNPSKIYKYQYKGKMYRLRTKRADLLVTPNHNLVYSHCDFIKKPTLLLKQADLLFNKSKRLKKDGDWLGTNPKSFIIPAVSIKHGSRFYSGYRIKKEKQIPIKLWLKFFGFWTAEGWTTEGKNGNYNICVCNNNKSLLKEMKKILEECGYKAYLRKNLVRVRDFQLFHYLKQFGKCFDKYFPKNIKSLSKELLLILFKYYIKGDGHIYGRTNKGLSATTSSIRLRDDLQEIALKMGISAYYKLDKKKGTIIKGLEYKHKRKYKQRNDTWIVYFIRKNLHTIMPSLIKKGGHKEKWEDFDGLVYCVTVPNCSLYIRRNGIPLWCGNSDPIMNWQVKELDRRSILSSSDAHSGPKLGREATVFIENLKSEIRNPKYSYFDIIDAIKQKPLSKLKIGYTIEFFPEEGKYHWSGHRLCNIRYNAQEVKEKGIICPVCKKPLTIGVENRVLDLSEKLFQKKDLSFAQNSNGLMFVSDGNKKRRPFVSLIPLLEVLVEITKSQAKAEKEYDLLITTFAPEFDILMKKTYKEIEIAGGLLLREAIQKIRERNVFVDPGYDGVFGKVKIFQEEKNDEQTQTIETENQQKLF